MMIGSSKKFVSFAEALEKAEKDVYFKAYKYYKQNQSTTAKALGVARGTFITKMKRWQAL